MKKSQQTIVEKKIKTTLPGKHRSNHNFSSSNGWLVEKKFLSIFKRMTQPPLLSKSRLADTIVV